MSLSVQACGQKRADPNASIDPATAGRLGLTDDAVDPTVRQDAAGNRRWTPADEPEGTAAPLSPTRRKIGSPNP